MLSTKDKKVLKARKLWVKALRSGKYEQGRNKLYSLSADAYCCLGVACDLYNKTHRNKVQLPSKGVQVLSGHYDKVAKWLDIDKIGSLVKESNVSGGHFLDLAQMNDDGVSFKQIARVIENQFIRPMH